MSKTIDFDAYRQEKEKENITIKAFGEKLVLPPSPPLSTMEKVLSFYNKAGGQAEIPESEVIEMIKALLGTDKYRKLADNGMTVEEAEWLIVEIYKYYNPKKDDTKNNQPSTS